MEKNDKSLIGRRIAIIICGIIIIACVLMVGNLHDIIDYNCDHNIHQWDTKNKSHIGNISSYSSRGERLDDNWVNIGNRYWYVNEIEDVEYNKDLGDLIRIYSYGINDKDDPHYGEVASLWIYDITTRALGMGMNRDGFYSYIYDLYIRDSTSIWKKTNDFSLLALTTGPRARFSITQENRPPVYEENFIIFANDRVYCLNFSNDKFNRDFEYNGREAYSLFNKRCVSIIKDIDLMSYHQWEINYNREIKLSEKQSDDRDSWGRFLYSIIIVLCLSIFVLCWRKPQNRNSQSFRLTLYVTICYVIILIAMEIGALMHPDNDETFCWLLFAFFPSFLIYLLMMRFLSKRSNEDYHTFYLIPNNILYTFNIKKEYTKRLLLLFIFYPLFFVVPLPVVGLFFLVFYVLPVTLLVLLYWGVKKIIHWLKEGRKIDSCPIIEDDKKYMYCRHCGKIIDACSSFCRFCGKQL